MPDDAEHARIRLADHGAIVVRGRIIDVVSRAWLRSHLDDVEKFQIDS
jgi:hypothetical protein